MTTRKHKIDPDAPVAVVITITGRDLDTAMMGLLDVTENIRSGRTSGEVDPGGPEGYTFTVLNTVPKQ